ncbi:MAG: hypothetical protein GTO45_09550 [Candidatus Aminicenantes bacterium]|nr:hypothetical protein [Candidatus Aminicenantes bacterium]NIM79059.1 hypothetical protein [Candidatus Aminicenantes bacterium]NIN18338.1 hypothetical protein [Candidatus Aminicenantes bacterium]NIN42225.1 hypothetical protein [Candidatus Aminicenantes bacterium]NIN84991.1 hypothetical protein [Candidatus Aminicenantes bacterium]
MPKKKKLKLGSLRVQSFVTELGDEAKKVKGGDTMNTQCIIGSCLECSEGICPTDFGSDCVGTCAGSNCVGTCYASCGGTCETCYTCGCPPITEPSCPQIICTA